ncbi:MAG TPA: sodium/solute symporter [Thermoanaerobaculia bacterium]|nr:sodium/solute symporter [Thermoanaerobaculia bacterium]
MSGATGLAGIDTAIVLIYLAGVLVIGTWFARFVRTSGDFFVAGRSLPFWAVGMSIVVSDIGATDFIAVAGGTYRYGLAQANFDWLGSMPALLIAAFLFVPYYWRSGVFTIPEFLGRRYGAEVRGFLALCWGLILVLTLGIMIHATAVLLRSVLGWDPQVSIWVTTMVVGIYTISGGLAAVVMTDVLQLVIMFVGGGALVFRALYEVGGWSALREGVLAQGPAYADHFRLYLPHDSPTPFPWTGIVLGLGIVLSTAYFTGNQAVVQRALGARSEWDAKAGVLFAGGLKLFIPLLVALPGLAAILIVPGLENPDEAVPSLIRLLLPPGLRGLMFAAFLAALMSSVDSALNSASTLWTQDLIGPLRRRLGAGLDERGQLRTGRIVAAILLLAAALVAPEIERRFTNIYNAIQSVFSLIQGPTLAILLLGVLWRRANRWGAIAGLVIGVGFCVVLNSPVGRGVFPSEEPFLFVAWWSFVLTLAVTALVSRLTPPEPPERIRGLVWGDVVDDDHVQAALRARIPDREPALLDPGAAR